MSVNSADHVWPPGIAPARAKVLWRRAQHVFPNRVREWISQDAGGGAVWAPVAIGVGAGVYFGLKSEPFWLIGPLAMVMLAVAALCAPRGRSLAGALFLAALGFAAADLRTARIEAPVLQRDLSIRDVTGRIVAVEDRIDDQRFTIALTAIDGLEAETLPQKARVTWRGDRSDVSPGDIITLRAGLRPPPPPASPGTFDFARRLYFQQIGAVGFAVSMPQVIDQPALGVKQRLSADIETLRENLARRITAAAPGAGGAIVAAVVTGKRDSITPESEAALRDAGLAHLLAISGLHMGLATGLIFFAVRGGLAAIEPLALNYPIKKWAAAAALLSGLAYLILSGGGWSARRAFIMTAIIFSAILADRRALSLRNVAIAAVIILLMTPEALFHPGFQMSFAAVTALIAAYEWLSRSADPFRSFTIVARLRRYAIGLMITDIIAALATATYALYHFNRVALYSLPANVLAMPLMGFWIMPAAVIGLLLTPLGLDAWAWRLSATGMETVLAIATEVSSWPGAVSLTPQWPLTAMLALTIGGLWLCLARSPLRLAGLAAIPAAALLAPAAKPPQLFVAASGLNAGVVMGEETPTLAVYSTRRDRFAASVWQESIGLEPSRESVAAISSIGDCDGGGCIAEINGTRIAFIETGELLAEDCARADIVVAFFPVSGRDWRSCKAMLIDRRSIWRRGAHAVWIKNGDIRLKTVAETRGARPWTEETAPPRNQ